MMKSSTATATRQDGGRIEDNLALNGEVWTRDSSNFQTSPSRSMLFEGCCHRCTPLNVGLHVFVSGNELRHQVNNLINQVSWYDHDSFQWVAEYYVSRRNRNAAYVDLDVSSVHLCFSTRTNSGSTVCPNLFAMKCVSTIPG